jgi:anti-anti-sigma factor
MTIKKEIIEGIEVVHLIDPLDTANVDEVKACFNSLGSTDMKCTILSIPKADYISSDVLGTLVNVYKRFVNENKLLVLCNLDYNVKYILKITGLEKVFPMKSDLVDAVNYCKEMELK